MLSLFPELFDWSFYVPFFFRLYIAGYLLYAGYRLTKAGNTASKEDKYSWGTLGYLIIVIAISLFVGAYVQITGVILFVMNMLALYFKNTNKAELNQSTAFYILLALVSLSLVFLGAGPYALDLPL